MAQIAEIKIIPGTFTLIKISDEEYFSAEYKDYISNSRLSLIDPSEGGSREKYEAGFSGGFSSSYELGSAVHASVLQPEFYTISNLAKPSGKLGLFTEEVYKFRKEGHSIKDSMKLASISADYYSNKFTQTRIDTALKTALPFYINRLRAKEISGTQTLYLSQATQDKHDLCMNGIAANPAIKKVLYPEGLLQTPEVFNEYAIFVEVDVTVDGVTKRAKLKAKLDNFTVNHETKELTLNDLKTTGKPVNFFMGGRSVNEEGDTIQHGGSFQKFHYYRQMAMYGWLMSCLMQSSGIDYKCKMNMVVVETIPTYKSKVIPVTNGHIKQGLAEFKKLLILVTHG